LEAVFRILAKPLQLFAQLLILELQLFDFAGHLTQLRLELRYANDRIGRVLGARANAAGADGQTRQ
jgi:hypothetical protein